MSLIILRRRPWPPSSSPCHHRSPTTSLERHHGRRPCSSRATPPLHGHSWPSHGSRHAETSNRPSHHELRHHPISSSQLESTSSQPRRNLPPCRPLITTKAKLANPPWPPVFLPKLSFPCHRALFPRSFSSGLRPTQWPSDALLPPSFFSKYDLPTINGYHSSFSSLAIPLPMAATSHCSKLQISHGHPCQEMIWAIPPFTLPSWPEPSIMLEKLQSTHGEVGHPPSTMPETTKLPPSSFLTHALTVLLHAQVRPPLSKLPKPPAKPSSSMVKCHPMSEKPVEPYDHYPSAPSSSSSSHPIGHPSPCQSMPSFMAIAKPMTIEFLPKAI